MATAVDERFFLEIPLEALLEHCDPMLDDPWGCGRIDPEAVIFATEGYRQGVPADPMAEIFGSYEYNVSRIAHFLEHGWMAIEDDPEPISIDIGIEGYMPFYLIADGNHRVAAAKLRGDRAIEVEITGDTAKAEAVFLRGADPQSYSSLAAC